METAPGHFLKRTLGRITARILQETTNRQSQRERDYMQTAEIETSGLQEKSSGPKPPILPDGKQPTPIGSGIITGILGEGGTAVLYEICNKQLGIQRAVKLLKPTNTRASYEHFIKEFSIGVQLNHPNIAIVHSLGQWQKLPFIEMEKISGYTLNEMVSQFGPLPLGLCTATGIMICKALEYLHTCKFQLEKTEHKGLLHLDLKPSNIILSLSGTLKIMDFGLSTPLDDAKQGKFPSKVGSPQYSPPELLLGNTNPDERSDIFSVGCLLYELASGSKVFPGTNPEEVMKLRRENIHVNLKKAHRSLPQPFIELIEQCLSYDKEKRPTDALSVRKQLEKMHSKQTTLTPESAIQLYVNQRKHNEPFVLPRPTILTHTALLYASGLVVALLAAIILISSSSINEKGGLPTSFINKVSPMIPSGPFKDWLDSHKSASLLPPGPSLNKTRFQRKDVNKVGTAPSQFYAPEISSDQADLMNSLRKEWASRNYEDMLKLIENLPPDLADSKEVFMYKLRALGRSGDELGDLLSSKEVADGEYYFHKARYFFGRKEYSNTLDNLFNAESYPSEFLDKRILGREVQLYRSRSLTAIFRNDPTSENLKVALQSWERLIELTSAHPESMHNREASREKQNLLAEASWRGIE
ncbi:MAG: serine/threonine protein kinase [Fibrobacter sp.]|jgi:serine/threonine protein kinase|nr:serine/threonine protein kinase [Fibrobacter sp.]